MRIPPGGRKIPIRLRFTFYLLAILALMSFAGVAALSFFDGLQTASDIVILLNKEKTHLAQNLKRQFIDASAQAVFLSKVLSINLEKRFAEYHLSISDLNGKPDMLTEILGDEVDGLLSSLAKTECTGVFFVLNATANPLAKGAATSRAGLYIRNVDRGLKDRNLDQLLVRGPAKIAFAENFTPQSRRTPEFDVQGQPFWEAPLKALEANPSLPFSRPYYWYFSNNFPGLSENTFVCYAPLLDEEGRLLGVCGFETGTRRFARDNAFYIDNSSNATGLFFKFSPPGERFYSDEVLFTFTGNTALWHELSKRKELLVIEEGRGLQTFWHGDDNAYVGLWSEIDLYPGDSPFSGQRFAAAVVIPEKDFSGIVLASRLRWTLIGVALLCAGTALSLFLSTRYEKPFKRLLESLKSGDMNVKTNIQEINDLLEFMRSQLDKADSGENSLPETAEDAEEYVEERLAKFIANTRKLSRAEADVFDLYFEKYTAQEIADILNISINTLKTHNKHIFAKLNVSSRKELLEWVQMLTPSGYSLSDSQKQQFDKIRNIIKESKT